MSKAKHVSRGSGILYRFNLDSITIGMLKELTEIVNANGSDFSQSACVRRAIRYFHKHILKLKSSNDDRGKALSAERIDLTRAKKGVL